VAATLNELASSSSLGIEINETTIPVKPDVRGACELLGIDPLHVANEGKLVVVVAADEAQQVLDVMRRFDLGRDAVIIGSVVDDHPDMVVMRTAFGSRRIIDLPLGEQLPRIC